MTGKNITEVNDALNRLDNLLEGSKLDFKRDDGTYIVLQGIRITSGVDENGNLANSDKQLNKEKRLAESNGRRAGRGEIPPQVMVQTPEGRTLNGNDARSFFARPETNPANSAGTAGQVQTSQQIASPEVPLFQPSPPPTPAFKACSKVPRWSTESGKPMVVYHGTASAFTSFDKGKLGSTTGARSARRDSSSSADPNVASDFASLATSKNDGNANIVPVYLSIQNPRIVTKAEGPEFSGINGEIDKAVADGNDGVILKNVPDSPQRVAATMDKASNQQPRNCGT